MKKLEKPDAQNMVAIATLNSVNYMSSQTVTGFLLGHQKCPCVRDPPLPFLLRTEVSSCHVNVSKAVLFFST